MHSIELLEFDVGFNQEPFIFMSSENVRAVINAVEGIIESFLIFFLNIIDQYLNYDVVRSHCVYLVVFRPKQPTLFDIPHQ